MSSKRLISIITLPWLAAALVILLITKLRDDGTRWHWGLFGSAAICFSIGCLARTSVMLAEKAQAEQIRRP
ncbi:MAG: hypothetical protein VKI39_05345 [Synechococcus sp.]|nr:hypothetical protein [Synechococcus sp.]